MLVMFNPASNETLVQNLLRYTTIPSYVFGHLLTLYFATIAR